MNSSIVNSDPLITAIDRGIKSMITHMDYDPMKGASEEWTAKYQKHFPEEIILAFHEARMILTGTHPETTRTQYRRAAGMLAISAVRLSTEPNGRGNAWFGKDNVETFIRSYWKTALLLLGEICPDTRNRTITESP